ncbi:MAG TPA: DHH family phosphoesterase, partial [Acidobacteriota bacterium]|nr:DHH family phosphoesterase [Acidobacteriota bacterium]
MVIGADILSFLKENDSFVITTHISPDGDGIGSALALSRGLKTLEKKAIIVDHSPTPSNLKFLLEDDSEIIQPAGLPRGFNPEDHFALVVDMGAFDRLGSVLPIIQRCKGMLVIDHHIVDIPEGVHSLIDPGACATGEVIYKLLKRMDLRITRQIAEPLYAAIETDTGGFR